MRILYQWLLRMYRENPLHMWITVLNMVFTYSLLTSTQYIINQSIRKHATDGDGMLWYIGLMLCITIIATSALTMHNAFSITIQERRAQYRMLSASGTTLRQIRGTLMAEAMFIDLVGLVFGSALGMVLSVPTTLWKGGYKPVMPERVESIQTVAHPRFLIPLVFEFLVIPVVMAFACGSYLRSFQDSSAFRSVSRFRRRRRFYSGIGRAFGIGGQLSYLIHRADKKSRALFLPTLVMSLAAVVLMTNLFEVLHTAVPQMEGSIHVHTIGNRPDFESEVQAMIRQPDIRRHISRADMLHLYEPGVFCLFPEEQVSQAAQDALHQSRLRRLIVSKESQMPLNASARDGYVAMPKMLFLPDSDFDALVRENGIQAGANDALWLRDVTYGNQSFAFLKETDRAQDVTLYFYSNDVLLHIDEKAARREMQRQKMNQGEELPIVQYCCNTDSFLHLARAMWPTQVTVHVAGTVEKKYVDVERTAPVLVLPERSKDLYTPYLTNASRGISVTLFTGSTDDDSDEKDIDLYKIVLDSIYSIVKMTDGYVSEHLFGEGTRYISAHPVTTNPPKPIFADIYPMLRQRSEYFRYYPLKVYFTAFIGSMLFTMFTNIVNVVYANHMLHRREYVMLESIGIDDRVKQTMLMYEGIRYSILSVLFSIPAVLVGYPFFSYGLSFGLNYERMLGDPQLRTAPAQYSDILFVDAADALRRTGYCCAHSWWVFLSGGLVVLGVYYLTNRVVDRRMPTRDIIPLLKKDI